MTFGFDWLDAKTTDILLPVIAGTAIGTLWRMVTRPETNWRKFLVRAFVALTVGPVIGCGIVQYLDLPTLVAVAVGSVCSFLAEEVLLFFQKRGEKLKQGTIDLSLKGDDEDE